MVKKKNEKEELKDMRNWEKAKLVDVEELTTMFIENLNVSPGYVSHGEIQMGVANGALTVNPQGEQIWVDYIKNKIKSENKELPSVVYVNRSDNKIIAFCVLELSSDDHEPFGVICDMLVKSDLRGNGLGTEMFDLAKRWFKEQNVKSIFLESGVGNHNAHNYFEKIGFKKVSHVFMIDDY